MMNRHDKTRVSRAIRNLTQTDGLPTEDSRNVTSLLDVGELQVAFEILCTQLFEYDVVLSVGAMQDLQLCERLLHTDPKYVGSLRDSQGGREKE